MEEVRRSNRIARLNEQYREAALEGRVRREEAAAAAVPSMRVGGHDVSSSSSSRSIGHLRSTTSSSTSTTAVADQNHCPNAAAAISTSSSSSLSGPKHRGTNTSSLPASHEISVHQRRSPYPTRARSSSKSTNTTDTTSSGSAVAALSPSSSSGHGLNTSSLPANHEISVHQRRSPYPPRARARSINTTATTSSGSAVAALSPASSKWYADCQKVKEWPIRNENGHVIIPRTEFLGRWVKSQRTRFRGTGKELTPDQITHLQEAGVSFFSPLKSSTSTTSKERPEFAQRIEELKIAIQQREKDGEDNPGWIGTHHPLGTFANSLRSNYNQKKLSDKRIQILKKIGFEFSESRDQGFANMVAELLEFREENGTCDVPRPRRGASRLSNWVYKQRMNMEWLIMNHPERVDELNRIGFVWKVNEERRRINDELRQIYEDDHAGLPISSDPKVHKRYARKKARQKVEAIKTSTTPEASTAIVKQTVSKMKKMNVSSLLFSSHFVSVSEDESDWGYHIHRHEELRTLNQTRQAHYMRPDGTRLIPNEDFLSFQLLLNNNGKFQFFVDAFGDPVQVNGGVSLSNCLEHCKNYQDNVGKLVALSIQLMTPGTVMEARRRERESQQVLWRLVPKFGFGFVMNSKDYSAGSYAKDAHAHSSFLNVLIGGEECIFKAKRPQIVLTSLVPQDSQCALTKKLPKLKFHNWPKSEPKPQDDTALETLQVTSKREEQVFNGMKFITTGRLQGLTQETVSNAITERGGEVCTSIKAGVKYHLVLGTNPSEEKLAAAMANKATVTSVNTKEFLALVKEKKAECQGR